MNGYLHITLIIKKLFVEFIILRYVTIASAVGRVGSALRGVNNQVPDEAAKIICEFIKKIDGSDFIFEEGVTVSGKKLINDFFNFYDAIKSYLPENHRPFQTTEERCAPGGDMYENWIYMGGKTL